MIRHVLALSSLDNRYGGPSTVARSQFEAQLGAGAAVELWTGWVGPKARVIDGLRTFPTRMLSTNFALLFAPRFVLTAILTIRSVSHHHVHLARDTVTMPIALVLALLRLSYTVQPHGMLAPSTSSFRRLFDKFVTRLVLARAKEVYFLNSAEAAALQNLGARASQLHRLGNGVACIDRPSVRHPSSGLPVRVLFAARLHPRKRVGVFLEAAADLIRGTSGDDWRFMVVGPDEGDLKLVLRSIESESSAGCLSYGGALEHSQLLKLMRQTDIFVLCSEDEPFGLAALEAMAAGSATVVTEGTGLTEYQTVEKSIATFDGSASGLAAAIVNVRREIGTYSRAALKQASSPELNINEIASSLLRRWGGL